MILFYTIATVLLRSSVTVLDRKIFSTYQDSFFQNNFISVFFPLCFCLMFAYYLGDTSYLFFIFYKPVLFLGVSTQLTGYVLAIAFKSMPIRIVSLLTKSSDLLIPILLIAMKKNVSYTNGFFYLFSTLAYLPILISVFKRGEKINIKIFFSIVIALLLQTFIVNYYDYSMFYSDSSVFFMFLMSVLCCRSFLSFLPLLYEINLFRLQRAEITICWKRMASLFSRSVLVLLGHAFFFLSIMHKENIVVWPLLNAIPLVSCGLAHFIIKEKVCNEVVISFILFIFITVVWILSS